MSDAYSIGHHRMKYLDMANMAFAQNNFIAVKGYIDAFLDTVKENSSDSMDIKLEFDKIMKIKKEAISKSLEDAKELDYLQKNDYINNNREQIEINALHDMKAVCWRVALKNGLFND